MLSAACVCACAEIPMGLPGMGMPGGKKPAGRMSMPGPGRSPEPGDFDLERSLTLDRPRAPRGRRDSMRTPASEPRKRVWSDPPSLREDSMDVAAD